VGIIKLDKLPVFWYNACKILILLVFWGLVVECSKSNH